MLARRGSSERGGGGGGGGGGGAPGEEMLDGELGGADRMREVDVEGGVLVAVTVILGVGGAGRVPERGPCLVTNDRVSDVFVIGILYAC